MPGFSRSERSHTNCDPLVLAAVSGNAIYCYITIFYIGPTLTREPFKTHTAALLFLMANRAASMTVVRSARSSHSMHECDDRVERIALMCVIMWLRSMTVEHLAAACQLAGKRGVLAQEA